MATANCIIYIGDVELRPYHIRIDQYSDWHHQFEITVSTEKAKVFGEGLPLETTAIDNAIAYAGQMVEITIVRAVGTLEFKGYVTDVSMDQTYAADSFIILKGYAPTYLLEGHPSIASFEEMSLDDIVNELLNDFPSNISKTIKSKYDSVIPYVVRYNESKFQFISRLAATYGEWFYFDGKKLVFGELPGKNAEVSLTLGSDSMLSFNYGIHLKPLNFKQQFYQYEENEMLEQAGAKFTPGWLDPHSKVALGASNDLFLEEGLDPTVQTVNDDKHLKDSVETRKSTLLSDIMLFSGQSAHPGIVVGAEVTVGSRNGFIGKYRVTSVSHNYDSSRDYSNTFQAIPVTAMVPPQNRGLQIPHAESQIGNVVENNDPEEFGRVRVKLKWQEGRTPWIRVLTNHAGAGHGQYFTPEIDDEVIVDFESGNPDRPFVSGSKYHGKIPPSVFNPENNLKAIKTRSGHTLLFDDADGGESITISDKSGNSIKLDTSGNSISISSSSSISISSGDISIDASNNVSISAGNDITLKAGNNVTVNAVTNVDITGGKQVNATGTSGANLVSGGSSVALTPADGKLVGNGKLELKSGGVLKVGANGPVEVTGAMIKLN